LAGLAGEIRARERFDPAERLLDPRETEHVAPPRSRERLRRRIGCATHRRRALRASSYFFPTASEAAILYCASVSRRPNPGGRFGKKFTPDFRTSTFPPGTLTDT